MGGMYLMRHHVHMIAFRSPLNTPMRQSVGPMDNRYLASLAPKTKSSRYLTYSIWHQTQELLPPSLLAYLSHLHDLYVVPKGFIFSLLISNGFFSFCNFAFFEGFWGVVWLGQKLRPFSFFSLLVLVFSVLFLE